MCNIYHNSNVISRSTSHLPHYNARKIDEGDENYAADSLSSTHAGLDVSQPPSTSTPAPYHYLDYDSDSYSDNDDFIGLLYPEEGRNRPRAPSCSPPPLIQIDAIDSYVAALKGSSQLV